MRRNSRDSIGVGCPAESGRSVTLAGAFARSADYVVRHELEGHRPDGDSARQLLRQLAGERYEEDRRHDGVGAVRGHVQGQEKTNIAMML